MVLQEVDSSLKPPLPTVSELLVRIESPDGRESKIGSGILEILWSLLSQEFSVIQGLDNGEEYEYEADLRYGEY